MWLLLASACLANAEEAFAESRPIGSGGAAGGKAASRAGGKASGSKASGSKASGAKASGKGGGGGKASGKGGHKGGHRGSGFARTTTRVWHLLRLSAGPAGTIRSVEHLHRVAKHVATPQRELMYTTVDMDRAGHQLILLRQWAGNLREAFSHALVVGANHDTCAVVRNASIPCFVDGVAPKLKGKQNFFGQQVVMKWWMAMQLLEGRFNIVFSDPDIAWLRDPYAVWDRSYDLQGLSDIRSVNLTVQKHHEITCMRPWMENMYEHSRRSVYPCQSTGLWYMRDLPQSRAFLATLYGYLQARPNEWEQKAFQLLVMRFLVGIGDELPPLRYRLLPTSRYINIEFLEERNARGMNVTDMVATHCGYLKGMGDKLEHLRDNGLLLRGLSWHHDLHVNVSARAAAAKGTGVEVRLRPPATLTYTPLTTMALRRKNHSVVHVAVRRS